MRWKGGSVHTTRLNTREANVQECNGVKSVYDSTKKRKGEKEKKKRDKEKKRHRDKETKVTGAEPPLHSGELNHALSPVGGPTQSAHVVRTPHLHGAPDTDASNEKFLKEKRKTVF